MTASNELQTLLTVREVATLFKVHPRTVYAWVSAGAIPHIRRGTTLRFSPDVAKPDAQAQPTELKATGAVHVD